MRSNTISRRETQNEKVNFYYKYAPMKSDFQKAISMDETVKTELSVDMSEVRNIDLIEENQEDAA